MSKNKCCGNCKHFKDEGADGFGWCAKDSGITGCGCSCHKHEYNYNGWAEITPDNVDDIRKNKKSVVIINPKEWDVPEMCYGIPKETLVLYSEWGGYYYYVLPELKIE